MVARFELIARMMNAAPRHIGDMKQAVDPADIDKCSVLCKVFDRAFDDVADIDTWPASRPFAR